MTYISFAQVAQPQLQPLTRFVAQSERHQQLRDLKFRLNLPMQEITLLDPKGLGPDESLLVNAARPI